MIGLKVHKYPQFDRKPTMLAALPDMGNVAGIGMGHMVKKLDAKLFAEIYSYWPPYVTYNNGIVDYSQSSYKFYSVEESDLMIFTGDFNPPDPRRLYEICYDVLKMAERLNIGLVYSIGAALGRPGSVGALGAKVYVAANKPEVLAGVERHGASILQGVGQISGFNGLILGLARERGIDGVCLLSEIDNPNIIQPKAAQTVLQVLIKMLGIAPFSMLELDEEEKRKKFMEQQMNYLEKVMERGEPPGIA